MADDAKFIVEHDRSEVGHFLQENELLLSGCCLEDNVPHKNRENGHSPGCSGGQVHPCVLENTFS